MRRSAVIAIVLIALAVLFLGGTSLFASPTTGGGGGPPKDASERQLVRPTDGKSGFWPYLSPQKGFQKRSPINVVVLGSSDQVKRALVESGDANWVETENETSEADADTYSLVDGNASAPNRTNATNGTNVTNGTDPAEGANASNLSNGTNETNETNQSQRGFDAATAVGWGDTTGATRYAYVDPGPDETGRWISETDQLHDGTYYGSRYHIRMYESPDPDEQWVAIQTHSEHFDWFTLRHRVTGSQEAQTYLERDLMALRSVDTREDVRRVYLDNPNSRDADGWATFVDLLGVIAVALAGVLPASRRKLAAVREEFRDQLTETDRQRIAAIRSRFDLRHVAMGVTIVGIVLGVRVAGIALERAGALSMHGIAALLYPVLAFGLPIGTYAVSRGLERRLDAAVAASVGFSLAIWFDYGLLGVTSLPIEVIVQRAYLVIALGLIAAGGAKRATREKTLNSLLAAGTFLWVLVLVGTLIGKF